ncbi:hypothetical protein JCM9492_16440 [Aquifex pyrophilus]
MSRREEFKYLLLSFILGISIWLAVNFGERLPLDITRFVELKNQREEYKYEVSPPFVDVTLLVSRKLLQSKLIERVRVYVDVGNLKEGMHRVRVTATTPIPILIEPIAINPYYVRVKVIRRVSR